MIRTMIESLLTDKSGYGKRTLRKDIGKKFSKRIVELRISLDYNHLTMIEQFHKQSFFWDYLLNFDGKVLSMLVFKMFGILLFSNIEAMRGFKSTLVSRILSGINNGKKNSSKNFSI
jgi:hypothetical protein